MAQECRIWNWQRKSQYLLRWFHNSISRTLQCNLLRQNFSVRCIKNEWGISMHHVRIELALARNESASFRSSFVILLRFIFVVDHYCSLNSSCWIMRSALQRWPTTGMSAQDFSWPLSISLETSSFVNCIVVAYNIGCLQILRFRQISYSIIVYNLLQVSIFFGICSDRIECLWSTYHRKSSVSRSARSIV